MGNKAALLSVALGARIVEKHFTLIIITRILEIINSLQILSK